MCVADSADDTDSKEAIFYPDGCSWGINSDMVLSSFEDN
jgi:hypothetical protein